MKNLRLSIDNSNYNIELDHNKFNQKLLHTLYVLYYQHNNIYFKKFDDISKLQETIDHSKFIIIFGHITNLIEHSHILNHILKESTPILNSLSKYFMIHINNNFGNISLKNYIVSDILTVNIHLPLSLYKKFDIKSTDSLIDDVKFNIVNNIELPYANISSKIFNKIDEYKKEITDIEYLDLELENLSNTNKTKELLNILDINVELHDEFLDNNRSSIHNLLNKNQEQKIHQSDKDTPIGDTSAGDTPIGDTPIGDTSSVDTSAGDTPIGDTSSVDTSAKDTSAKDTSAKDTSAKDTSAGDTSARDTIKDKLEKLKKSMTIPEPEKLNDSLLHVIEQDLDKPVTHTSIKNKLEELKKSMTTHEPNKLNDSLLYVIEQELEKPMVEPTVDTSIEDTSIMDKLEELKKSMTTHEPAKLNDSLLSVIDQELENPMVEPTVDTSMEDISIEYDTSIKYKLDSLLNKRKDYLKKYKKMKELQSNKTKLYNNEKLKGELKKIIQKHVNIKSLKFDESNINHMVYNILLNEYNSIKINKKIVESEIRNQNCNDVYNLLHDLKKHREKSYDSVIQNNIDDLNKYDKSLSVYNTEFIQSRDNIINIATQYIDDIHSKNTMLQNEFKKDVELSKKDIYSSIEEEQYNTESIINKQKELTKKYNKEYSKNLNEINKNESYIKSSLDILSTNYKRLINKHNDKLAQKINNIKKNTQRDIINRDLQDRIYQPMYDIVSKSITIQNKKEEEYTMFDDVKHNLEKERDNVLNDFQDDFKILKESIQERKAEYEKIKNERKEIFRRKLEYKIDKYMNRNKLTTNKKNPNILYKKKTYKSVVLW